MSSVEPVDLRAAAAQAAGVRELYHQLERAHEGTAWSTKDDVLGLVNDVGVLARLVMATGGQWKPEGDVTSQLEDKLAEALWWILSIANRLDVDIGRAFTDKMARLEVHLSDSVDGLSAR